ncbi:hypothetical protein B9Z19DRAFT_1063434 [Tuber borchii]|uniref:Uncharacterized protein n=1 Tax=Tuber borchii TaxID=42251 RepID=A0A2T6ZYB2_TUBBO|nr:hypothetical protein B9Z19DRAFT_1063434 [Tuber borchii]
MANGKGLEAELALAVPVWVRLQRYGERTTDAGELLQTPAEDPATKVHRFTTNPPIGHRASFGHAMSIDFDYLIGVPNLDDTFDREASPLKDIRNLRASQLVLPNTTKHTGSLADAQLEFPPLHTGYSSDRSRPFRSRLQLPPWHDTQPSETKTAQS